MLHMLCFVLFLAVVGVCISSWSSTYKSAEQETEAQLDEASLITTYVLNELHQTPKIIPSTSIDHNKDNLPLKVSQHNHRHDHSSHGKHFGDAKNTRIKHGTRMISGTNNGMGNGSVMSYRGGGSRNTMMNAVGVDSDHPTLLGIGCVHTATSSIYYSLCPKIGKYFKDVKCPTYCWECGKYSHDQYYRYLANNDMIPTRFLRRASLNRRIKRSKSRGREAIEMFFETWVTGEAGMSLVFLVLKHCI